MKLVIEIQFNESTMQTYGQAINAIRKAINTSPRYRSAEPGRPAQVGEGGNISDKKHNSVGTWQVQDVRSTLSPAEQFFYDHGGYSWDPKTETADQGRARCARGLARAEKWARENDYYADWVHDDAGCSGCDCGSKECPCSTGEPHEVLGCHLRDHKGTSVESLWGICGADADYRRVVEAELADQAMAAEGGK